MSLDNVITICVVVMLLFGWLSIFEFGMQWMMVAGVMVIRVY